MKKIVFGITSLTIGGAERVLVDIANTLKDKYDITILTIYPKGQLKSQLNKKIKVKSIFKKQYKDYNRIQKVLLSLSFVLKPIRKKIYNKHINDKYDVEIAFLEGPITTLFSANKKHNAIAWIHNDISLVFGDGIKSKMKKLMNRNIYTKFRELVFVSKDNLDKFNQIFSIKNNKRVIYNYLNIDNIVKKSNEFIPTEIKNNVPSFFVAARLVEQKGLLRLLEVHRDLLKNNLKHNIYIAGDGPLKDKLNEKINEYGVSNSFVLLGSKINPYPYMKKADVFMLPSFYEGYGIVIIEARILKKYILITDTAAREALNDYKNAIVVPNDEQGIYEGMKKIINKDYKIYNVKPYSNEDIINDIIELIES